MSKRDLLLETELLIDDQYTYAYIHIHSIPIYIHIHSVYVMCTERDGEGEQKGYLVIFDP